jgi:hypothetical protein
LEEAGSLEVYLRILRRQPLPLSLLPIYHEVSSFLYHMLPPWCTLQSQVQSNRAKWPWLRLLKPRGKINLSSLWGDYLRYFTLVVERWLIQV